MDDVYFHIYSSSVFRKQQEWHSDAKITIRFTTEGVQPGQSTREAKNFWECRAAETLIPGYMRKQFKETLPNFQKNIATYAAKMLVEDVGLVDLEWSDNLAAPDELAWEHINYHTKSIRARYQFLLDNSVGPVGDCMDMLRLHCFKTMFSSRSNYFNRHEWVAGRDSGELARASSKINRRLRALFDPYASGEVLRLRQTCSHLRAVPWATASSQISPGSRSPSLWLEHYPNGI
ncbi:hypothetical protein NW765_002876 [Fusarium oxysporum]|nr:hypothetical protein NW765_002876 [Fusarium oxysporum]KAJ4280288.1 hypothetical protein NW764_006138 [Fusarium oxysporum]